jgi:hypothetical protein
MKEEAFILSFHEFASQAPPPSDSLSSALN